MNTAAYNGVFLAPESIVVFPGSTAATLQALVDAGEATDGSASAAFPEAQSQRTAHYK